MSRASPEGSELQLSSAQCCVVFPVAMAGIKMGAREGGRREESGQESRAARMGEPDWSRRKQRKEGFLFCLGLFWLWFSSLGLFPEVRRQAFSAESNTYCRVTAKEILSQSQ